MSTNPKEEKPNEFLRWTVEIQVARIWVEDGFDLTEAQLKDGMEKVLPYAYDNELRVKIVKAPPQAMLKAIRK